MPKDSKKRKEESASDSDSSSSVENPPKKKKVAPKSSSSKSRNDNEEPSWDLDNKKIVKVREFRGKVYVDIREYYEKDGELLPGKKGISLPAPAFQKLRGIMDEIAEELKKF